MIPDHGGYDHENESSDDEEDYGDHESKLKVQHSFRQENRNTNIAALDAVLSVIGALL